MQVEGIVHAYNISALLADYVKDTRRWLYDEVFAWLHNDGAAPKPDEGDSVCGAPSRMFLLMAGPGMGKSVFSAVIHTELAARTSKDRDIHLVRSY